MSKFLFLCLMALAVFSSQSALSQAKRLPAVQVSDMNGKAVDASSFSNDGKPVFITFWATWCKPCINELDAIQENIEEWKTETGVRVIAVSIDDARSKSRVPTMVSGRNWDCEIMLDENSNLKRALNVTNPPHAFILDKDGNIVWEHNAYQPGDEDYYLEILKKLAKGEIIGKQ